MKFAIDTNCLLILNKKDEKSDDYLKLKHQVELVDKHNGKIIIPTPVVSEFIICERSQQFINLLSSDKVFFLAPFDTRSAVLCAQVQQTTKATYNHKKGPLAKTDRPWQKIKIDRQILAISKNNNVDFLLSLDGDVHNLSNEFKIKVCSFDDLDLPDSARQRPLEFEG